MELPICIKTLGQPKVWIDVGEEVKTVEDVRRIFSQKTVWKQDDFRLIHDGIEVSDLTELSEMLYLHECILANNNSLTMWAVLKSSTSTPLFLSIRCVKQKYASERLVQIHSGMTVQQLKVALQRRNVSQYRPQQQMLILSGRKMLDSDLLGEYVAGTTAENATNVLLFEQSTIHSTTAKIKVLLVGGGHYATTVGINDKVESIKQLLIASGVYAKFQHQMLLYDATTRRELHPHECIKKYDLGPSPTLYAVPTLSAFTGTISGKTGRKINLAQRLIPNPIDLFFPSKNNNGSKRIGPLGVVLNNEPAARKMQTGLVATLRRGFFSSEATAERVKLKVKRISSADGMNTCLKTRRFVLTNTATGKGSFEVQASCRKKKRVEKDVENQSIEENRSKPSNNASRCCICTRKLPPGMAIAGKCRCGQILCAVHIHSANHKCSYNFKEHEKNQLERLNQPVSSVKVTRI